MRMRKLFPVAIAATAFLFAAGCCEIDSDCYGVRYNPCNPCGPSTGTVYLPPAPPPRAVVDCPPPRPPKPPKVRQPRRGCGQPAVHYYFAADPCLGNPPLLIHGAEVVAMQAPVDCPPPPPLKVKRVRPAPPPKTKVRGRTRTIIPVVNNSISADCDAGAVGTVYMAPPPQGRMTPMRSRPIYVAGDAEAVAVAPEPAKAEKPVRRERKERKASRLDGNPPLLSESAGDIPAATAAALSSGSDEPELEAIPYPPTLDREGEAGPEPVRRAAAIAPPSARPNAGLAGPLMTEPPEIPAPGAAAVAGQTAQGGTVEPWMLQRPEPVTASGFEPGALPGCAPAAYGCPPAGHLPGCPGPAPCGGVTPCGPAPVAGNCPQPFQPLCQPSDTMSGCFSLNDDQLMNGPQVLTPNAMTPLPVAPAAPLPALTVPGQSAAPAPVAAPVPAAAPQVSRRAAITPPAGVSPLAPPAELVEDAGKYGALTPAASVASEQSRPDLSMPTPIGGNIPPIAPAQEIESALDAMLSGGV